MSFLRVACRASALTRPRFAAATFVRPRTWLPPKAAFSTEAGLSKEAITTRVLDVLKGFEKVDVAKLATSSSFTDDLGLDSLDTVEAVMMVEEEFQIEIPDAEADEIKTVQQAIDYVANTPEAR